jgi:hypothetical protein
MLMAAPTDRRHSSHHSNHLRSGAWYLLIASGSLPFVIDPLIVPATALSSGKRYTGKRES